MKANIFELPDICRHCTIVHKTPSKSQCYTEQCPLGETGEPKKKQYINRMLCLLENQCLECKSGTCSYLCNTVIELQHCIKKMKNSYMLEGEEDY